MSNLPAGSVSADNRTNTGEQLHPDGPRQHLSRLKSFRFHSIRTRGLAVSTGLVLITVIIAVAAVVTGLFNLLFFAGTSTLGASGVVFAFILLSSITMREGGTIPLTFLLVALLYIGQQLLQVFQKDNISQLSHIVGGAVGTVAGFMLSSGKKKGA